MPTATQPVVVTSRVTTRPATTLIGSRYRVLIGRGLSALAAAFLLFDSIGKLLRVDAVVATTTELGYPTDVIFALGLIQLLCLIAYLVPATSPLGALLLTGYLGGAIATHVRVGNPLATHVLFPMYVAILLWGGLVLRDPRLAILLPMRKPS